jgi:WD40 repeat protein
MADQSGLPPRAQSMSLSITDNVATRESAAEAAALHGVVPADMSTRIKGHNFAIQLLRVLEGQMDSILTDFARESGMLPAYVSGAASSPAYGGKESPSPRGSPSRRSPAQSPRGPSRKTPSQTALKRSPSTRADSSQANSPGAATLQPSPRQGPSRTTSQLDPAAEAAEREHARRRRQRERRRALDIWKAHAAVDRRGFVGIMASRVEQAINPAGLTSSATVTVAVKPSATGSRSPQRSGAVTPAPATVSPPRADDSAFTWFNNVTRDEIAEELGYVFDAADAASTGRITFDATMAYIVDCALQGDVGYVAEAIPLYGSKGSHFLRGMDDVTAARYCPELGKTLTAGKKIGIMDAVASQTFIVEYPKPEALRDAAVLVAAGGKFVVDSTTVVYSVDYIPHLAALLVAGTDRGMHVIEVATGEPLFFIKTPEPCTLCVYDRSSHTIVATSRTFHIRCFKVAPHRHADQRYEATHVMREHTNMVTHLCALGHDGLVAGAGLDGRVVVFDVRAGTVFTRFAGHQGQPVCALRYVASFGYMASCSLHADPRVWIVSAMASRSDCFRLSDNESPHTERVVDICDVPGSPQLLTLDRNGMIKVWDLRSFLCVQTLRTERTYGGGVRATVLRWHTLVHDPAAKVVIAVSTRRIQSFCAVNIADGVGRTDGATEAVQGTSEHYLVSTDLQVAATARSEIDRQKHARALKEQLAREADAGAGGANHGAEGRKRGGKTAAKEETEEEAAPSVSRLVAKADDFPVVALALNLDNGTCMTASDKKVRVWDVFTGKLEARFDRLAGATSDASRITALCVATSGRCFMLGFQNGRLASHAYSTGGLLHTLVNAGDGPEVTRLTYLHGTSCFVVSSWDGCRLFQDKPSYEDGASSYWPDESRGFGVRAVGFDPLLSLLAVGFKGGEVRLYEGRRHRFIPGSVRVVATYNSITTHDVEAVCVLQGYPAIAVSDSVGQVFLVTTPPHAFAGRCFGRTTLKQRIATRLLFVPSRALLYLAADTGALMALELEVALRTVNLRAPCGSWESMMTTAGRSGAQPRWVEELVPRRAIQAHSDAITDLAAVAGAGLLLSASADRTVLAWTTGLFLRGEYDNTATFGRYIATVPRPMHPATTGMQFYREAAAGSVGGSGDVMSSENPYEEAIAIGASLAALPTEDDWNEIPLPFADSSDDDGAELLHSAVDEVTPSATTQATPQPDDPLLAVQVDGAVPNPFQLHARKSTPAGQSRPISGQGGRQVSASATPRQRAASTQLLAPSMNEPHPAVRSVPRAAPHPIVGARKQRMTNDRALQVTSVIETSADDEATLLYHDQLQAFLSTDVQDAMRQRTAKPLEERLREDAHERRLPTRSTDKATALTSAPTRGEVAPDLPSDLPSTMARHTRPAIAGPEPDRRPESPPRLSDATAVGAVKRGVHDEHERARAPLLSSNSCGVDFHTVFSFAPCNPRHRIPKAFVVETAASAGTAGSGADFVVTQDRPNPPQARELRDFELKRIMDAEDARQETVAATRRLEESILALAASNSQANFEVLNVSARALSVVSSGHGHPGEKSPHGARDTRTSSFRTTARHPSFTLPPADAPTHANDVRPTTAAYTGDNASGASPPVFEEVEWLAPGQLPAAAIDASWLGSQPHVEPGRRVSVGRLTPSAFGSILPEHLSPAAALGAMASANKQRHAQREATKLARKLVPAELLQLRRVQSRAAQRRGDDHLDQLVQRARVHELERRATTPGLNRTQPAAHLTPLDRSATPLPTSSMAGLGGRPGTTNMGAPAAAPLPAPLAGQYSCFSGCQRVEPLANGELLETSQRSSAQPLVVVAMDPTVEFVRLPDLKPTVPLDDASQQDVTMHTVDAGTQSRPPTMAAARRGLTTRDGLQRRRVPETESKFDTLAFTTLGVRQIPLVAPCGPQPGAIESRPGTTPTPLPMITMPDGGTKPTRRQVGTPALWAKTHRV